MWAPHGFIDLNIFVHTQILSFRHTQCFREGFVQSFINETPGQYVANAVPTAVCRGLIQTQGVRRRHGRGSGGAPRPSTLAGRPSVEHNPQRRSVSCQEHVSAAQNGDSSHAGSRD